MPVIKIQGSNEGRTEDIKNVTPYIYEGLFGKVRNSGFETRQNGGWHGDLQRVI